ncbi:hypothetical protein GQ55_7G170000 [Panicum hallii var. hallii]|uniref:Uncharacterized protein n=1 Tax=Panicum hallii var. hallii TaxID=1504633 RepID=A0A2T7CVY4_9POAL|nr:hypothetical protein GQ55_7G170000 [Panicum hallii var. hallii]
MAEAEVHLSVCAQHRGSAPLRKLCRGDVAGRRTAQHPPRRPPARPPSSNPNLGLILSCHRSPPGSSRRHLSLRLDFTDLACPTVSWQREPPPLLPPRLMPCMADPFPEIGITGDVPLLARFASSPCHTPSLRFALFRGLPTPFL